MVAQLEQYSNGESREISYVEFIGMIVDDNDYVQQHIKTHLVAFREAFNLFDTSGRGNRSLASPCALLRLLYLSSPPVWLHMLLFETLSPSPWITICFLCPCCGALGLFFCSFGYYVAVPALLL